MGLHKDMSFPSLEIIANDSFGSEAVGGPQRFWAAALRWRPQLVDATPRL